MTAYIDTSTQEYPLYEGDIRLRFPNTSFGQPFTAPDGYEAVAPTQRPTAGHAHNVKEGDPALADGVWTQQWIVTDASAEEIAERVDRQWIAVRSDRNARLSSCDWTQLPDCPLTNVAQTEWATYRQALRDITEQADPFNIVWPEQPA